MNQTLPFNQWSRERIRQGIKTCTCRTRKYYDSRVKFVIQCPLWFVKEYLWKLEGASSPEEFEKVIISILGSFEPDRIMYVHFGDFKNEAVAKQ